MDAIAVTYGPGLVGPLLIGVSTAKALAYAKGIPLVGVNHIEGHICANYLIENEIIRELWHLRICVLWHQVDILI